MFRTDGGMFAGSDGSVWAAFHSYAEDSPETGWLLAGWDGQGWTTHVLDERRGFLVRRLPDGAVLIGRDEIFDGTEVRQWEVLPADQNILALDFAPDGSAWGLMSINGDWDRTSLYVITPEALTAAE